MRYFWFFILSIGLNQAFALTNKEIGDAYFLQNDNPLTPQEKKALRISDQYQTGKTTSKPTIARDGSIEYRYGSGQFQILCAPLQICDVALQPGESFNNINVGDTRFEVRPGLTGTGELQRIHLLINPKEVGLDTTLVVTTDRRAYHFRLRSTREKFMPLVTFSYPEDIDAEWRNIKRLQAKERIENTLPQTGEYLGNLNFNYLVFGTAPWKPCRVYNDGVKTIIEMPKAINQHDAPTLLILRSRGFLKSAETVMVNYRIQNNRYIVDAIFDKAILVAGVGPSQKKITIRRKR